MRLTSIGTLHRLAASLLVLAGCASGGSDATKPHEKTRGDLHDLVGDFSVRLMAQNPATGTAARSTVFGVVKDGPEPETIVWHATEQAGDCTLSEPEAPFCDTPCGGSAACTGDDQCTPYPKARSVGTVELRGLGSQQLQLTDIAGKYMPDRGALPYPPCHEGDTVELHTDGGDYAPFMLETRCIAPLSFEPPAGELTRGRDLALMWGAAGDPELAHMLVKLDVSHHGGAKGKIECTARDTGELTIESALIDRLIELGVAGFPTISLTRSAESEAETEPRAVHLSVLETVEHPVQVPGVMSCTADPQCPQGQKCATNLTCQSG